MVDLKQSVIDCLKVLGVEFDESKITVSSTGRIVNLPDPHIKLIRQEDHWGMFDCKAGSYVGGGDGIDECLEALYG
jgi:hypothetical protein